MLSRCVLVCVCLGAACQAADSWPSFHNGGNTSIDAHNLPVEWSPDTGTAWKIELPGYGQSSPVIWKDRVYVTATDGKEKEHCLLMALELDTGKTVWSVDLPASIPLKFDSMVSRAAPTPTVDGRGVHVFFESGDLFAFDHQGDKRWQISLFDGVDNAFQNNHGYGASPAQTDDAVILLVDHKGPSYLLAVDKDSGNTVWKTDRSSRSSWSSPRVAKIGEQWQVVVSSNGSVDGYDAASGKLIWSCDGINGNTIPSATVVGDLVFVGASSARGGKDSAANCCLKIHNGADVPSEVLWKAEKASCSYVSPMFHEGYVYSVNAVGVLFCLEAATGKQCYAERIDSSCWAQPIAAGDRIYCFGKKGVTSIIKAGPTFELVATNRLWTDDAPPSRVEVKSTETGATATKVSKDESIDPVVYGVAAVDKAFIVRVGTHLFRIGQ